jgi:predicted porin
MNLKKTILALAVAGVAAAPMMASAAGHGPDSAVYGSLRYGVESVDAGGTSDRVTTLRNFGSRFGIKGETDLGNGMTAFGKWEAHMFGAALRDFQIGLKGDFGQVYAGDGIDHAWDSYMSTDDTWWYGGQSHLSDGVQSNAITYMGGAGGVTFGVTARLADNNANAVVAVPAVVGTATVPSVAAVDQSNRVVDDNAIDAIEAVVAFDAGPVNIALGMTDVKTSPVDTEAVIGLVVKGAAGGFGYKVDFQSQGAASGSTNDDASSLQLQGSFGSFYAQYGSSDTGAIGAASATPTNLVLGYTQTLGAKTLVWYEFISQDADVVGTDTSTTIAATLKYDIL